MEFWDAMVQCKSQSQTLPLRQLMLHHPDSQPSRQIVRHAFSNSDAAPCVFVEFKNTEDANAASHHNHKGWKVRLLRPLDPDLDTYYSVSSAENSNSSKKPTSRRASKKVSTIPPSVQLPPKPAPIISFSPLPLRRSPVEGASASAGQGEISFFRLFHA